VLNSVSAHANADVDLPYLYHSDGRFKGLQVSRRAQKLRIRESPADVVSFAGCKDAGTSADTVEGGLAVGAMSYVRHGGQRAGAELIGE
jgi:hypothetical protein